MTLKGNISATLKRARQSEGSEFTFKWSETTFRIAQLSTGQVKLAIERSRQPIPDSDWDYIVSQWPEAGLAEAVPTPRTEGRKVTLTAFYPRPAVITETA